MTIPNPEPQSTLLTVYCYDTNGLLKPNVRIKIELISGNAIGAIDNGPIYVTANEEGTAITQIVRGANLNFRIDRLDNTSKKGSFFKGTNDDYLVLDAVID